MIKSDEKICFIFNPASGRERSVRTLHKLRREADRYWQDVVIRVTEKEGDLAKFAREAVGEFDKVVACGGDGTIHRITGELAGNRIPVGLIPLGSGNDFAKAMGLPHGMKRCLEVIRYGAVKQVDLIRFEGDIEGWCANTLGCGLDGWANHYKADFPRSRGALLYLLGTLKAIWNFRGVSMDLEIDGKMDTRNLYMVTFCNGPVEGGRFRVAPDADFSDGWLDLLVVDRIPVWKLLWYLPQFLRGPRESMKGVHSYRCKHVVCRSASPLAAHCDGEEMGTDIRNLSVGIRPAMLNLILPADSRAV